MIITSITSAVDDKKSDSSTNITESDDDSTDDATKEDDKMTSVTCQSCSRCNQPLPNAAPEKERYISRVL